MDPERKGESLLVLYLLHVLLIVKTWWLHELALLGSSISTRASFGYLLSPDICVTVEYHEESTTINFRCDDLLPAFRYRVLNSIHI